MYPIIDLFRLMRGTQVEIDGKWVPARPVPGSLMFRLSDAWKVLTGEADAITWPGNQ